MAKPSSSSGITWTSGVSGETSAGAVAGLHTGPVVVAAFFAVLTFALIYLGRLSFFIGDSWTYFALSRSIASDFYHVANRTSFVFEPPYSVSYPPLWPALLFLGQQFLGPTPIAGIVLNFVLLIAFTILAEGLARRAWGLRWIGVLTGIALLGFAAFVEDMFRATAAASASVLILGCLWLFVLYPGRRWMPFVFGLLAGATVMVRFDFMISAVAAIFVVALFERRLLALPSAAAGVFLGLSPWIVYSLTTFHSVFASENRVTALLVDPSSMSWDFHPRLPPTLFDDPSGFAMKIAGFLPILARTVAKVLILPVSPAVLLVLSGIVAYRMYQSRALKTVLFSDKPWRAAPTARLVGFAPIILVSFFGYLATGYVNVDRYLTPFVWYVVFVSFVVLTLAWRNGFLRMFGDLPYGTIVQMTTVVLVLVAGINLTREARCCRPYKPIGSFADEVTCLKKVGASPGDAVLFVTSRPSTGQDHLLAAEFGALSGWTSSVQPNNWDSLSGEDIALWANRFGIRYAHIRDKSGFSWLTAKAKVTPLPGCGAPLFRFEPIVPSP